MAPSARVRIRGLEAPSLPPLSRTGPGKPTGGCGVPPPGGGRAWRGVPPVCRAKLNDSRSMPLGEPKRFAGTILIGLALAWRGRWSSQHRGSGKEWHNTTTTEFQAGPHARIASVFSLAGGVARRVRTLLPSTHVSSTLDLGLAHPPGGARRMLRRRERLVMRQ